jgi:predicted TIM-barrel fold metal-dependent hydrolase
MLIDIHAHFYTELSGRSDWTAVNDARLAAGRRIGITIHVASILGTWGARSPTYFPSERDVSHANGQMVELANAHPEVLGYCVVNPNYTTHALQEIENRVKQGMVGVKLAASRRADDELLDPIAALAGERGLPILHHVWHHRRRDWPGQEASDALELATLADRHPDTQFIMAHLGGGGDWSHSLRVVRDVPNIWLDLSGSGVDADMLDAAVTVIGPDRLLWGTDVTLDTGWAKLRYLESTGLAEAELNSIKFENARRIFPDGIFNDDD